jgi:hypothetical protein
MTEPQSSSSAPMPTPHQLNKITAQLRDLNNAYKAAAAANVKTKGTEASAPESSK